MFTRPTWARAQALLGGVLLAPANATVTAALRALGLAHEPSFQNFHRVLNRARWSARAAAGVLLGLVVEQFVPVGPVVLGLDETIERRRGRKLTARGIYYDAVRSSRRCRQKTSGLRWLSLAVLAPIAGAGRSWALPCLTASCPSSRYRPYVQRGRRHKAPPARARGLLGQVRRWLPDRPLIVVADAGYAALDLLGWCARQARPITFITRLRLDAALYAPPPAPGAGRPRRRRLKGERLPALSDRLTDPATAWQRTAVAWYGGAPYVVEWATGTAVWHHKGKPAVPLRWVLVRDPQGRFKAQALLATDPALSAVAILEYFVRRWAMEVTFQETRRHLGLDGQRHWNDRAVARATPLRLGLFSLVTLLAQRLPAWPQAVRRSAWYPKARPTFADALAQVRRALWGHLAQGLSATAPESPQATRVLLEHFAELLAYAV